ncbi:hypothetical protein EK21DRAFT_17130, partial [Setomelanomma holmii]
MSLLHLPIELIFQISDRLSSRKDLNAFARASVCLHQCLNKVLYKNDHEEHGSSALYWAAVHDRAKTAHMSL